MKLEILLEEFNKQGVYKIVNLKNGKFYIGSTTLTFKKRLMEHLKALKSNTHKNSYLQKSWNKYGETNFKFTILEVCKKEDCLTREQFYIDSLKATEKGYNINPRSSGTPNLSKETIEKRRQTMLRKYANGELDHVKEILKEKGRKRKGIKPESTDHLKVPKTITESVINSRAKRVERVRESSPEVFVYDSNYNFLGKWRSIADLSEWSLTEANNLPIKSRFSGNERTIKGKSTPSNFLKSSNMQTAIKNKTLYKNLYFSYKPLHQVTDVEKLDKFGETPAMDNTEPSTNLND